MLVWCKKKIKKSLLGTVGCGLSTLRRWKCFIKSCPSRATGYLTQCHPRQWNCHTYALLQRIILPHPVPLIDCTWAGSISPTHLKVKKQKSHPLSPARGLSPHFLGRSISVKRLPFSRKINTCVNRRGTLQTLNRRAGEPGPVFSQAHD